ncbi:hypothetical protein [Gordonia sp. NPDC127522]
MTEGSSPAQHIAAAYAFSTALEPGAVSTTGPMSEETGLLTEVLTSKPM